MVREFHASAAKTRHGLILAGLLAAIGIWILLFGGATVEDHRLTGGLALGLAAAVGGTVWWKARGGGALLRVDNEGVWFKDWGLAVPWQSIEDVYQSGTRLQPFVTLRLRDPEAFLAGLSASEAKALRGNRLWKRPELKIPSGAVAASQREIEDAILEGLKDSGSAAEPAR